MASLTLPPAVKAVINTYPPAARRKILSLRKLAFEVITDNELPTPQETLKWGEPGFLVKGGSTLRMAWKESRPDHCSLYFNCQTTLLETFREIYPDAFQYDGKRAIHLPVEGDYPVAALRHCIAMTLMYHQIKHLQLLGA